MPSPILRVENLTRGYPSGGGELVVLQGVSFELEEGSTCAIVGPSGSGKTTLLGLCAGLDRPSSGSVELVGHSLAGMEEDALAQLRNTLVGFVFQSFRLLPTLTALENTMVPLELRGEHDAKSKAQELLGRVGLAERQGHYPAQLSGGEQQRVALARAFIHEPRILFADEPTGNLDDDTSQSLLELLFSLNREAGTTLVMVTHDMDLARRCDRLLRLGAGHIVADETSSAESQGA